MRFAVCAVPGEPHNPMSPAPTKICGGDGIGVGAVVPPVGGAVGDGVGAVVGPPFPPPQKADEMAVIPRKIKPSAVAARLLTT
jgi:hypothetical protein